METGLNAAVGANRFNAASALCVVELPGGAKILLSDALADSFRCLTRLGSVRSPLLGPTFDEHILTVTCRDTEAGSVRRREEVRVKCGRCGAADDVCVFVNIANCGLLADATRRATREESCKTGIISSLLGKMC